jgi:hypothetical protein
MAWVIYCDCGTAIRGVDDDEIVENAINHAKNKHALILTREQVLALAESDPNDSNEKESKT